MKKYLLFSVLLFSISSGVAVYTSSSGQLMIHDAWVKLAPPNTPMAGYMELHNGTLSSRKLIGAEAEGFGATMIHRSFHENGIAKMEHMREVEFKEGEKQVFEPGGLHIMLMKPEQSFKVGDVIPISLSFDDGSSLNVDFSVKMSADQDSKDHDHSEQGHSQEHGHSQEMEGHTEDHQKHGHSRMVSIDEEIAPEFTMQAHRSDSGHWVLMLETHNFLFSEEHQDQPHIEGEGHGHLYINGEKVSRVFSKEYHLPDLQVGVHEIVLRLYTNDHARYTVNGNPIEQKLMISVD